MKKIYYTSLLLLYFLLLWQCKSLDRISALRIVDARFTENLLSMAVSAEIIDSEKKNAITDHGFCYTVGYALPALGDGFSDTLSLGTVTDENLPFEGIITELEPGRDYYIRAYMVIEGKVVYSAPKSLRTRDFIPEDFNVLVSNALVTENEVSVKAFVNKARIEARNPVTVWQYGSIVASEPDSTHGLSNTYTQSPPNPITYFNCTYPINLLPVPTVPSNKIYVWAYADVFLNENPSITQRIYSKRKEIDKLN